MGVSDAGKKGRMRKGERNAEKERKTAYHSFLARVISPLHMAIEKKKS